MAGEDRRPAEVSEFAPKARRFLGEASLVVCGLFLAFLPVAIWVAWSREMLIQLLFYGLCALTYVVIYCLGVVGAVRAAAQWIVNQVWYACQRLRR